MLINCLIMISWHEIKYIINNKIGKNTSNAITLLGKHTYSTVVFTMKYITWFRFFIEIQYTKIPKGARKKMNKIFMFLQKRALLPLQFLAGILLLIPPLSALAESITNHYDAQQRLTGTTYDSGIYIGYTYDNVGNRLTETVSATPQNAPAAADALDKSMTLNTLNGNAINSAQLAGTGSGSNRSTGLQGVDSQNNRKNSNTVNAQDADPSKISAASIVVYEDAEDGEIIRWRIDENSPGASIQNIYDSDKKSNVIKLSSDAFLNSFNLQKADGSYWNDAGHKIIQWEMKYSDDFVVSVAVQTSNGVRYLSFTPEEKDALGKDTDVFHGLGADSKNGKWRTYIIDLGYALQEAQPNATLNSVLGFYVNGSGLVDDIRTRKEIPADLDSNGNGVTDINEMKTGTNPYRRVPLK